MRDGGLYFLGGVAGISMVALGAAWDTALIGLSIVSVLLAMWMTPREVKVATPKRPDETTVFGQRFFAEWQPDEVTGQPWAIYRTQSVISEEGGGSWLFRCWSREEAEALMKRMDAEFDR
jgi:hypothetical protein